MLLPIHLVAFASPGSLFEMHDVGSDPHPLNQNLHFTKLVSPVTFEQHYVKLNFLLQGYPV